ncbi:MAG: phosphotransferase, partial [Actinobacteria bacterium]|nr:phosphotransferase [Actinomycetota bacterium]
MAEQQKPTDRLAYTGDLEPVIDRLCEVYSIGRRVGINVIEVGYEDCNVIVETDKDKYLAKMFTQTRTANEIARYTTTMQKVVEAGVHHPELLTTDKGDVVHTDKGITLVLMRFVEGKTFFELDRAPDTEERKAVLEQAAKVNSIDYKPTYIFDSWAIPNIRAMFDKVRQFVEPNDLELVEQAMTRYEAIPVDDLPHCFVHGDFTKTNVLKDNDNNLY